MMRYWTALLLSPLLALAAQPNLIQVHFGFTGDSSVAIKSLSQGFGSLGYRLDVESVSVDGLRGDLNGNAVGIRPFSADVLSENLKETGMRVGSLALKQGSLRISADTQQSVWNVPYIGPDEGVELQKTASTQWFRIEDGQNIRIQAPYNGRWYPDVAVLDSSMEVLYSLRSKKAKEELELELPGGARYLKVSNLNGMKVMQEGMWIESVSRGR